MNLEWHSDGSEARFSAYVEALSRRPGRGKALPQQISALAKGLPTAIWRQVHWRQGFQLCLIRSYMPADITTNITWAMMTFNNKPTPGTIIPKTMPGLSVGAN